MPMYDYFCIKCEKKFTESKMISERDNCFCECGEKALRGIAAPPFHLKGSGWSKVMSDGKKPKSIENKLADNDFSRG